MEMDNIIRTADRVRRHLLASRDAASVLDWGVCVSAALEYGGMPALCLKVCARLFDGMVVVARSETDLYEVFLLPTDGEPVHLATGFFGEELVSAIDYNIERGEDGEGYSRYRSERDTALIARTTPFISKT